MPPTLFTLAQAEAAPPDGLYDIVLPAPERSPWPLFAALVFALLLAGAVVWLVRFLLRNRPAPDAPPSFKALREFDRLDRERDELAPNRFALAVSDALKDYFTARFRDPVRYETAEEFLARLAREGTRLPPAVQQELRDFLTASEEVKFANRPDAAEWTRPLMQRARALVSLCESVNAETK